MNAHKIDYNWGKIISEIRTLLNGVSRKKFGEMLDVGEKTIIRWENGEAEPTKKHKISILNLNKILNTKDKLYIQEAISDAIYLDIKSYPRDITQKITEKLIEFRKFTKEPSVLCIGDDVLDLENSITSKDLNFFYLIKNSRDKDDWETIYNYGSYLQDTFSSVVEKLRHPAFETYLNWLGVAALRVGDYSKAEEYLEFALDKCEHPRVKLAIKINTACLDIKYNKYTKAERSLLMIHTEKPNFNLAIYNLIALYSLNEDINECRKYFDMLVDNNEAHNQKTTDYIGMISDDPDMKWFSKTSYFNDISRKDIYNIKNKLK